MNKKTKTGKSNLNANNGLQHQLTNHFLDEREDQMLTSGSMANTDSGYSPIFRHAGSLYQSKNENEFKGTKEAEDFVRSPAFNSSVVIEREQGHQLNSSHEAMNEVGTCRPSPVDIPPFSPENSHHRHSTPDRRGKHFPSTSPPLVIQGIIPFNLHGDDSHHVEERSKLINNFGHSERNTSNISDGLSISNSSNVSSDGGMPNLVAAGNQDTPLKDGEQSRVNRSTMDIKKEATYRPQVEAISPTGSGDEMSPNDAIRHSKDEILQNINKLDRHISSIDQRVNKLRRLKEPLEEKSCQSLEEQPLRMVPIMDSSKLGVAHLIYSENKAKASESHQYMKIAGHQLSLPLYQKPSDTHVYHENIQKFSTFKPHLITYIKKRKLYEMKRDVYLCKKYDRLSESWVQRMDRIENNPRKRAKDAKTRELFEKVFPDLRRKREEKERLAKMVKKSEAESTMDAEENEVRMRMAMAVEPPIMLNPMARRRGFLSENGHIRDNFELDQLMPVMKKLYWTKSECDIFRETYITNPKNFPYISSQLQNKTIQDCIYFYYVTKKEAGYKQLVRRSNMNRRKHDKAKKVQKEVKEEKVEEDIKDLKFLPSSPVFSSSSSSPFYNSYQFKLPKYLLLPSSTHTAPSTPTNPLPSPSLTPPYQAKCPSSPQTPLSLCGTPNNTNNFFFGTIKEELDVKFSPPSPPPPPPPLPPMIPSPPLSSLPPASSSHRTSPSPMLNSSTEVTSVSPVCPQLHLTDPFSPEKPSILSVSLPNSSSSSYCVASPHVLTASHQVNNTSTTASSHQLMNHPHPAMLPPPSPHLGGSIVQGTPMLASNPNEQLSAMWQQVQLHFLLQQQFQQQQRQQDKPLTPLSQYNPAAMPMIGQDHKGFAGHVNQEARGSIIKGTPNHIIRDPPSSCPANLGPSKPKQERISPINNHSSPKRPSSGRMKVPSHNENNPIRMEGGHSVVEEGGRLYEHSRDILIDDYMTAQKMNSQQKNFVPFNNCEQSPSKKQSSTKRKLAPPTSNDGLIYFGGMEIPKASLPHQNESARSLIDNIISQNISKGAEEERNPLKALEGAKSTTPSRINSNFQSPGPHYFQTSCGPPLQNPMMLQSLLPPFFASGLNLLQGPFPPMYPPPAPMNMPEKGKMDIPNFASPPPPPPSHCSPGIMARPSVPIAHAPRNMGDKNAPRQNNIYNNFISTNYNIPPPPPSSLNPAFPPMISHPPPPPPCSSNLPSSGSPGFHPPASFLQMFPIGQFMPSFPLQMPPQQSGGVVPPSTLGSRQPVPQSPLFMSQLIQNFHQELSAAGGAMMAPKSTSATSGHA